MKRTPLQVSLHARESSIVELTVADRVQLDRLTPAPHGYVAQRHGRLLDPGTTTVALPPGRYFFKTLSAAHLRVVTGGVSAGVIAQTKDDGGDSDPPKAPLQGDDTPGESPRFMIEPA